MASGQADRTVRRFLVTWRDGGMPAVIHDIGWLTASSDYAFTYLRKPCQPPGSGLFQVSGTSMRVTTRPHCSCCLPPGSWIDDGPTIGAMSRRSTSPTTTTRSTCSVAAKALSKGTGSPSSRSRRLQRTEAQLTCSSFGGFASPCPSRNSASRCLLGSSGERLSPSAQTSATRLTQTLFAWRRRPGRPSAGCPTLSGRTSVRSWVGPRR